MPRMADGRDVPVATFGRPDLTTFTRLDELGHEVIGQRLEPDCGVLACRVVDPDDSAGAGHGPAVSVHRLRALATACAGRPWMHDGSSARGWGCGGWAAVPSVVRLCRRRHPGRTPEVSGCDVSRALGSLVGSARTLDEERRLSPKAEGSKTASTGRCGRGRPAAPALWGRLVPGDTRPRCLPARRRRARPRCSAVCGRPKPWRGRTR
jgi:hypothetical protein